MELCYINYSIYVLSSRYIYMTYGTAKYRFLGPVILVCNVLLHTLLCIPSNATSAKCTASSNDHVHLEGPIK
jgi:hypothetical protein